MSQYTKQCPTCQAEISYKYKGDFENSIQKNIVCRKCSQKKQNLKRVGLFFKNCPKCDKKITITGKHTFEKSVKENFLCSSCSNSGENNGMFGKTGEKNHWFGKHHTEETKKKISKTNTGKIRTEETKLKISEYKKANNPMKGGVFYLNWIEKYGKEIADQKMESYRQKRSDNNTGSKHPNFGKPPPKSASWGLTGWFNNFYFRSSKELMFLIYAKRFNLKVVSAESKQYAILYSNGQRNYFGDFIVNDKFFVEIKPKGLWEIPKNLEKFSAGKEYCLKHDFIFKVIDPPVNFNTILALFINKEVIFTERSEKRFKEYIDNKNLRRFMSEKIIRSVSVPTA